MSVDADRAQSASHVHAFEHLTPPFQGGAHDTALPLDAAGAASVTWVSRYPLLLVGTHGSLGQDSMAVTVTVTIQGASTPEPPVTVTFAPFTESGAFLPVFGPDPALGELSQPFAIHVEVVAPAANTLARDLVDVRLVEGVLGRLLYIVNAEKQRVRRQARELYAARRNQFAHGDALDRLGAELGVPRFADTLEWDEIRDQPTSQTQREPDAAYRQRLAIYRPFFMPTKRRVEQALNGDDSRPGLLGALGVTADFEVSEANCELAVAMRLLPSGDGDPRKALLDYLRAVHLVQPGAALPASRLLPRLERASLEAALQRLASRFDFPANAFIARHLAEALDRLGRCRAALGSGAKWRVLRAQDDAGGSRFELGLGAEIALPDASELEAMATHLRGRDFRGTVDLQTQVLLDSLSPRAATDDPEGRWLLQPCGLDTVHRTKAGVFLSHLPMFGMQLEPITGPTLTLAAQMQAPGDPDQNAILFYALRDSLADATAAGLAPLTVLASAAARSAIAAAVVPTTQAFARVGLRTPMTAEDLARTVAAFADVPDELMVTLRLDSALAAAVIANTDAAAGALGTLIAAFKRREMVSVLPLVGGANTVLLVVAVTSLPGAAVVLNSTQRDFRWYVLPIQGDKGAFEQPVGARNRYFAPVGTGLCAAVAVTLMRSDQEDPRGCIPPFETRVDLPAGARLTLRQYEYLMNLLQRAVPLGVVVDTSGVRTEHVDPAGTGSALPLVGRTARAFRVFRQPRHLGIVNPDQR